MASTQMIKNVNITAKKNPPEIDEFKTANLTPIPSLKIKPNRIKECKIHIECQLIDNFEITESRKIITANSLAITINSDVYLKKSCPTKRIIRSIFYVKGSYFALGRFVGKR